MQSEEGFRLESLLFQSLSETNRRLQVILDGGGNRTREKPGQVSADGDRCEVKRSKASPNLLEGSAIAGITSEEESMIRTQNRPAAP
ncbi:hypothetical protein FQN60_005701 [Etheostoma spectabile]|uniref:Uncharacterized protein n=1 Tax=Etheostoma spectabile TaxID=54343 RepID=A0A5J5CI01_9PERO|nr:hypothetical protein FQN60_005701 [Etheostoma spectabile]